MTICGWYSETRKRLPQPACFERQRDSVFSFAGVVRREEVTSVLSRGTLVILGYNTREVPSSPTTTLRQPKVQVYHRGPQIREVIHPCLGDWLCVCLLHDRGASCRLPDLSVA